MDCQNPLINCYNTLLIAIAIKLPWFLQTMHTQCCKEMITITKLSISNEVVRSS